MDLKCPLLSVCVLAHCVMLLTNAQLLHGSTTPIYDTASTGGHTAPQQSESTTPKSNADTSLTTSVRAFAPTLVMISTSPAVSGTTMSSESSSADSSTDNGGTTQNEVWCLNGGELVRSPRAEYCRCPPAYRGRRCEIGYCRQYCRYGGTCVGPDRCRCPPGFTGPFCRYSKCPLGCPSLMMCVGPNRCAPVSTPRKTCYPLVPYTKRIMESYVVPVVRSILISCGTFGLRSCYSHRLEYTVAYRTVNKTSYRCVTPVDGGWSEWSDWTGCPVSCGGGLQARERECINPAPRHGGRECTGDAEQYQNCSTDPCPAPVDETCKGYHCCSGLNSTCKPIRNRACYCDEGCIGIGDCCPDYFAVCGGSTDGEPEPTTAEPITSDRSTEIDFTTTDDVATTDEVTATYAVTTSIEEYSTYGPPPTVCGSGWLPFRGSYYCVYQNASTWFEGNSTCSSIGTHLVWVESEAENQFLRDSVDGNFWLGMRNATEGVWIYEGTSVVPTYFRWYTDEPNDKGGNEDCVIMYVNSYWNDLDCNYHGSSSISFVCESA